MCPIPFPEQLKECPLPMCIFEAPVDTEYKLTILDYSFCKTVIYPAHRPQGKLITVMRVKVPAENDEYGTGYLDITSRLLQATLLGLLEARGTPLTVKIKAYGKPPKKRYKVEIITGE